LNDMMWLSVEIWATSLSALLKGKALYVYARMPASKALPYDDLKTALLKRFNLTEDGFRVKFRSSMAEEGETFQQYASRLSGYLGRWIELAGISKTFEVLYDLVLREPMLNMCSRDLTLFIKDHVPHDIVADQFREARNRDITTLMVSNGVGNAGQNKTTVVQGK